MEKIVNSFDNPSFGSETEVLFDSVDTGVNPNDERIIVDAKIVQVCDGSTQKWVSMRRLDSVRVIAEKDGEIYFAKQRNANGTEHFHAFGGSVMAGEDHETAAKRELLEESGFRGTMELLSRWNNPDGRLKWVWSIWIAHNVEKIAEQALSGNENIEIVKAKNFEEFMQIATNTHPDIDIPFKDKNFTTIINNYVPVNPAAVQAISARIRS